MFFSDADFNLFKSGPAFGSIATPRVYLTMGIWIFESGLVLLLSLTKLRSYSRIMNWIYLKNNSNGILGLGAMALLFGIVGCYLGITQ